MNPIIVRSATIHDIPRLSELWQEKMVLIQQSDPRFPPLADGQNQWANLARQWIDDRRCRFLVAQRDDHVSGYIIGWLETDPPLVAGIEPPGFITDLALDMHTYQGGLGRTLLQAIREWFEAHDRQHVIVCIPHHHAVQQAFWRSLGATSWVDLMWIK